MQKQSLTWHLLDKQLPSTPSPLHTPSEILLKSDFVPEALSKRWSDMSMLSLGSTGQSYSQDTFVFWRSSEGGTSEVIVRVGAGNDGVWGKWAGGEKSYKRSLQKGRCPWVLDIFSGMFYIYVEYCLLLGILVAKATESLVITLQSLSSLGHHDTGYYSMC